MADGPEEGLRLLDELAARGELDDYQHLHSARGGLLRKLGRHQDAAAAYGRALELATNPVERRFLERRLAAGAHAAPRTSAERLPAWSVARSRSTARGWPWRRSARRTRRRARGPIWTTSRSPVAARQLRADGAEPHPSVPDEQRAARSHGAVLVAAHVDDRATVPQHPLPRAARADSTGAVTSFAGGGAGCRRTCGPPTPGGSDRCGGSCRAASRVLGVVVDVVPAAAVARRDPQAAVGPELQLAAVVVRLLRSARS